MRFLYDQNLSYRLVAELQDLYPDSLHVLDISMKESGNPYRSAKRIALRHLLG